MAKSEKQNRGTEMHKMLEGLFGGGVSMRALVIDGKGVHDLDPEALGLHELFSGPEARPDVTDVQTFTVDKTTYTLRKQGQWYLYTPQGNEYAFRRKGKAYTPEDLRASVEEFHWEHGDPAKGRSPKYRYELHELSAVEKSNYLKACKLVRLAVPKYPEPQVCDFYIGTVVHGIYKFGGCGKKLCSNCRGEKKEKPEIFLSKHILVDLEHTLEVLVHEVAHEAGSDGTPQHLRRLQGIWAKLVMKLHA